MIKIRALLSMNYMMEMSFTIDNGKRFIRIEKLRKNYKCKEISTGKLYRFSPLAEVKFNIN